MSIVDERVLEYLSENDPSAPKKIKEQAGIPYTREYVGERCIALADHEFLQPLGNGVYRITDRGRAYLAGEYDAREDADVGAGNSTSTASA